MTTHADLAAALDRLAIATHRQRAAAASTLPDLNATDLLALTIVYHAGAITPGALGRSMHLTNGGTDAVLRRVIAAKVIDRTTSCQDHRDVTLTVAERGKSLMMSGAGVWDSQLLDRFAALADSCELVGLLGTIAQAAEQRADVLSACSAEKRRCAHQTLRPLRWG